MSEKQGLAADQLDGAPHPAETAGLFAHAEAEQAVLEAYRGGAMPHAWLITGPEGIGKATLAYRAARFILANPDPRAPAVRDAADLAVDPRARAFHTVASFSHPDLMALRRIAGPERERLPQFIPVEDVRRLKGFFSATASAGGWRIAIVDTVDEMNAAGMNAMLKVVEEPPPRSLIFLISHVASRVLPTIRSRCRRLPLRPLGTGEIAAVLRAIPDIGAGADPAEIEAAAKLSGGSARRAVEAFGGDGFDWHQTVAAALEQAPGIDPLALHRLGDQLQRRDDAELRIFIEAVRAHLTSRLAANAAQPPARLAGLAEVWEKVDRAATDTRIYNLDRKPLVFNVFSMLLELSGR